MVDEGANSDSEPHTELDCIVLMIIVRGRSREDGPSKPWATCVLWRWIADHLHRTIVATIMSAFDASIIPGGQRPILAVAAVPNRMAVFVLGRF